MLVLPVLKKWIPFPAIVSARPRVRIAPSPTGMLHLGTARTALFNFLFARHTEGKFILRIEDTDLERSNAAFERDIIDQLHWLGLSWDEGVAVNGPFGPYRQSERLDRYTTHIQRLLENGLAYFCFCSEQALEKEREQQRKAGNVQRYSRTCRSLSQEKGNQRIAGGERALIRFRMPEEHYTFHDLIRGDITFDTGLFGDIVLAKVVQRKFQPLYNFAAVIDDAEMRITHVFRGDDHIANTPKQLLLFRALNLAPPAYGHFSMILAPDRSKLSKRHGATAVQELREAGYFPEAVVNFLALLGWNSGTDQELFTLQELIAAFDLGGVQHGGAIWNQEKLEWFNRQWLASPAKRWLTKDPLTPELKEKIVAILSAHKWTLRSEALAPLTALLLERTPLAKLEEALVGEYRYLFEAPTIEKNLLRWKIMTDERIFSALKKAGDCLDSIEEKEWAFPYLEKELLAAAEDFGGSKDRGRVDRGEFLWPLRVALSGEKRSPGPFTLAAILGREETKKRIDNAKNIVRPERSF